jgi:hypothetical protein
VSWSEVLRGLQHHSDYDEQHLPNVRIVTLTAGAIDTKKAPNFNTATGSDEAQLISTTLFDNPFNQPFNNLFIQLFSILFAMPLAYRLPCVHVPYALRSRTVCNPLLRALYVIKTP